MSDAPNNSQNLIGYLDLIISKNTVAPIFETTTEIVIMKSICRLGQEQYFTNDDLIQIPIDFVAIEFLRSYSGIANERKNQRSIMTEKCLKINEIIKSFIINSHPNATPVDLSAYCQLIQKGVITEITPSLSDAIIETITLLKLIIQNSAIKDLISINSDLGKQLNQSPSVLFDKENRSCLIEFTFIESSVLQRYEIETQNKWNETMFIMNAVNLPNCYCEMCLVEDNNFKIGYILDQSKSDMLQSDDKSSIDGDDLDDNQEVNDSMGDENQLTMIDDLDKGGKSLSDWKHQEIAIERFLKHNNGILQMATGSGKTRTALRIVSELIEIGKIKGVVVATRGNDLLSQWYTELLNWHKFDDFVHLSHFGKKKEIDDFMSFVKGKHNVNIILSYRNLAMLIAKNRTTGKNLLRNYMLICDEIHNLGAKDNVKNLDGELHVFPYKLGLSATPEREYDQIGSDLIRDEIGDVIFEFSLEDAIANGILCEFNYEPLYYNYNEEDKKKVKAVYSAYGAKKKQNPNIGPEFLFIELARIKKESKSKLPIFKQLIEKRSEILERCIIFAETKEYGYEIQKIIQDINPNFHTYYSEAKTDQLFKFIKGKTDCLITCKKISEGIDIKNVNSVVLFSTSRAKIETIQKIGRCLRINPDDVSKISIIVDFIKEDELETDKNNDYIPTDLNRYNWLKALSQVKKV